VRAGLRSPLRRPSAVTFQKTGVSLPVKKPTPATMQWIRITSGPALFILALIVPVAQYQARGAIGLLLWMAAWWITRPVHLGVTSFLPLPVLAIFNFVPVEQVLPSYANIIVILLLGANMMTVAWTKWGVDKRVALLALSRVGTGVKKQIMVWFTLSVLMSAVLPNTVVAATLIPIAVAMLAYLGIVEDGLSRSEFATGVLLSIAWGSSVGGFGSPLGGAMNLITMRFVEQMVTGREFMFWVWVSRLFPLVIATSVVVLSCLLLFPYEVKQVEGSIEFFKERFKEMGPLGRGEKWSLALFAGAAGLAFLRPIYASLLPSLHPAYVFLTAGILTFVIPVERDVTVSTWEYTQPRLMWGLIYLFAGGTALGRVVELSGAGSLIAEVLSPLATMGHLVALTVFATIAIVLTNISSNTATCAITIPIVINTMQGLGVNPIPFVYVTAAAANAGFVLPSSSGGPALAAGYGVDVGKMVSRGTLALVLTLVALVVCGYALSLAWVGFWQA